MITTEAPNQTAFTLKSEDDGGEHKMFPWRQVMGAMKRICPDLRLPEKADRRDAVMRNFWRKRGKTIAAFELLAKKVAASDYIQAKNGHTGKAGRAYPWSWIFEKNRAGDMRADAILDDDAYSNEKMAFLLEEKIVQTKVLLSGDYNPSLVNLSQKLPSGQPRYVSLNSDKGGYPNYLDRVS